MISYVVISSGGCQIQLLADLNLKKTPQLVELVDDSKVRYSILFPSGFDDLSIEDFSSLFLYK